MRAGQRRTTSTNDKQRFRNDFDCCLPTDKSERNAAVVRFICFYGQSTFLEDFKANLSDSLEASSVQFIASRRFMTLGFICSFSLSSNSHEAAAAAARVQTVLLSPVSPSRARCHSATHVAVCVDDGG